MNSAIEIMMILLVLSDMALLGLSRLRTCISIVSFQGMLLGVLALTMQLSAITPRLILIAAASFIIKGFIFPFLLRRGIREAGAQYEIEPFVGYIMSVIAGLAMLGISFWLGAKLPLFAANTLLIPAALTTLFTGLFLIIARKNALNQCLGYIIMENGIYTFGIVSVAEIPLLVELGILLDVFVAVFVMGIAIYHINREFDHLDSDRLNILKG
ncbi:MAG: Hydrogenase-4 component E [Smithella sp. PtaU1.Bin162]|nr:MAG: Hydrogenase-4 component E [Smithella sp. PtaU1.Bin162]